ncbi:MAG: ATP synthase F0 subunit B [bacterium]|nr:ATP synthase F0 subunit B [bacterium]
MEFNGTFLATIVTFILFVFLMNKVLYAPILSIMEKRQNFIDENYKSATDNNTKSEELTNEKAEKLLKAKNGARETYLSTLFGFKTKKAETINEAQSKAKEKLNISKDELDRQANEVKENLKGRMADLANDIVEKVLGYRSEIQSIDNEKVDKVLYE